MLVKEATGEKKLTYFYLPYVWCAPELVLLKPPFMISPLGISYDFENVPLKPSGGRLNKKDGLTRYGDSHVKDKTSWRPSYL